MTHSHVCVARGWRAARVSVRVLVDACRGKSVSLEFYLQAFDRKSTGIASGTQDVLDDLTSEPRVHDQLADNRTLTRSG